jgi:hypothetical protein
MKKKATIFICILLVSKLNGQEKVANVEDYLYTRVYKNISAYNIRYGNYQLNGSIKKDIFRDNSDFFYEPFIAGPGFKLDMKIEKIDSNLPDSSFTLYKIFVGGFDYTNKSDTSTITYMGQYTFQNFLVALNEKNGEIKFISGQFFLSAIADEFHINTKVPESLIPYLEMRTFVIGGKNISYWRRRHKQLFFNGDAVTLNKKFIVSIDMKNPDLFKITIL